MPIFTYSPLRWYESKGKELHNFLDQTVAVAKEVKIPVCLVGGIRGQKEIERILNETPIQYISMARPFVAKPYLMTEWNFD